MEPRPTQPTSIVRARLHREIDELADAQLAIVASTVEFVKMPCGPRSTGAVADDGSGLAEFDRYVECPFCHGLKYTMNPNVAQQDECGHCHGTGEMKAHVAEQYARMSAS